ncbi:hypothetical protein V8D89_012323 [Ganoderma adspersum]
MLQDGTNELLHLADIRTTGTGTLPADPELFEQERTITAQSYLAEEDVISIKQVPPTEIQEWCLARIAGHRDHSRYLRELYGPAARTAIWNIKSHIRALRFEYNAFAPINHLLPPEVLVKVFSHVHPAVVYRRRVPVLHVCRYWRMILFKIPQFWANLLSLPLSRSMNPNWRIGRFTAALALSAPLNLALSLPFWSLDVVDIVTLHASRLASLTIRPTFDMEPIKRLFEQRMPHLRDLVVFNCTRHWRNLPLLYFHQYPNVRSLQLRLTLYYSLVAPYASLHHLELTRCTMRAWHTSRVGYVPWLHSTHDALELFPNLETLILNHSLSEGDWFGDLPKLTKTVHLPHLRRLEIKDIPICISDFLSHLALPLTTSLVLEPDYLIPSGEPLLVPVVPVFPGTTPSPAPHAEISLHLDLRSPEELARWETHGDGIRPVRVTLARAARLLASIAHFTRELAQVFECAVTTLTVHGTWPRKLRYTGSGGNLQPEHSALEHWTTFLPDLARLRRIVCATGGASQEFVELLGQPLPASGGEFPCPGLEDLTLVWAMPYEAYCELLAEARGKGEGDSESEDSSSTSHGVPQGGVGWPRPEYEASLGVFDNALGVCLEGRVGHCVPLRKLTVVLPGSYGGSVRLQRWQSTSVEQDLRDRLGHLVREVSVVDEVE